MYKVRIYQEKDKDGVENVCVAASSRAKGKDSPWAKVILRLFCRYYIEMESEHCVVAVNEEDEVIGYVICASNYDIWKEKFSKFYLDTCEDEETVSFGRMCIDGIEEYAKEYPAHLHRRWQCRTSFQSACGEPCPCGSRAQRSGRAA